MTDFGLKYNLNLPEDISTILSSDCWILTNLDKGLDWSGRPFEIFILSLYIHKEREV